MIGSLHQVVNNRVFDSSIYYLSQESLTFLWLEARRNDKARLLRLHRLYPLPASMSENELQQTRLRSPEQCSFMIVLIAFRSRGVECLDDSTRVTDLSA